MFDEPRIEGTEGPESHRSEPTAREVNRQLRAERAEEKLLANLRRRGLGSGKELIREVTNRWPGEPYKQSEFFFDAVDLFDSAQKPKLLSYDAKQWMRLELEKVLYALNGTPSKVADLTDLTADRVLEAVVIWCERGLAAGTIQSRVSVVRRFFVLIGEPDVLPHRHKFEALIRARGLDPERVRRRQRRRAPASNELFLMGSTDGR